MKKILLAGFCMFAVIACGDESPAPTAASKAEAAAFMATIPEDTPAEAKAREEGREEGRELEKADADALKEPIE